jgi:hypothetical protein
MAVPLLPRSSPLWMAAPFQLRTLATPTKYSLHRVSDSQLITKLPVRIRVTLRLAVYRQSVRLGYKPLETHDQHFSFPTDTCCHGPYATSPLKRRWVCNLQLLLVLASAVILGSESRGTHVHILLSQFRDSPNLEDQVPVFISPRSIKHNI